VKDREDVGPTDQATVGEVLKVTAKPSFVTGAAVKGRKIRPVTWAITESGRGPVNSCPPPPTRVLSTVAEPASSPPAPSKRSTAVQSPEANAELRTTKRPVASQRPTARNPVDRSSLPLSTSRDSVLRKETRRSVFRTIMRERDAT